MYSYPTVAPIRLANANGIPFALHPLARPLPFPLRGPVVEVREHQEGIKAVPTLVTPPIQINDNLDKDAIQGKLLHSAKLLHDQAKQSRNVYQKFLASYDKDVKRIAVYASEAIIRQVWKQKVDSNHNTRPPFYQDDLQLTYQRGRLTTCFQYFRDATNAVFHCQTPDCRDKHDSRALFLDKVLEAGGRVDRLSTNAMTLEAACRDLVAELDELIDLLDSKNDKAKILYRFHKKPLRENQSCNSSEGG
jgi:hypothetical protein